MKPLLFFMAVVPLMAQLNYDHMADRIVKALALSKGERVILRYDPGFLRELSAPLKKSISAAGAVVAAELEYLEPPNTDRGRLAEALASADVYLWLPMRADLRYVSPPETLA